MEINLATAKHVARPTCAWLLLNFFPFPVGQTIYAHCTLRRACAAPRCRPPQLLSAGLRVDLRRGQIGSTSVNYLAIRILERADPNRLSLSDIRRSFWRGCVRTGKLSETKKPPAHAIFEGLTTPPAQMKAAIRDYNFYVIRSTLRIRS